MIDQEPPKNLDALARLFLVDELGLRPEDIPEATQNLVGAFDVLNRIYERINKQQL